MRDLCFFCRKHDDCPLSDIVFPTGSSVVSCYDFDYISNICCDLVMSSFDKKHVVGFVYRRKGLSVPTCKRNRNKNQINQFYEQTKK